jgi:hypothetical protein
MIGTSGLAADYGTSGAGTGNPTNDDQSYVLSFYQIQGVASGLSTTAVQITNIVSSNGLVKTMGDWMSFSNFAVFLTPGTTNAFALSRLAYKSGPTTNYFNGEGFMHLMVVTNNIGSGPATHYFGSGAAAYNGMTVMITNGTAINYGGTSQINQSVYRTNASTVFDVGISTSFLPAVFLAQPQNYYEVLPGTSTATLIATAAGSSNTAYGINGYWMVTNGTYPSGQILANAYEANATIATTVIPSAIGAAGATVTSTLTISNWTTSDAGSYVFIVTNSPDGVSLLTRNSAFATLSIIGVQPNSFASAIFSNMPGLMAYYPLNEQVDPSTGTAVAYELVQGANGVYPPAANNGAGNAGEASVLGLATALAVNGAAPGFGAVPGPGAGGIGTYTAPLSGLPSQGALGLLNGSFQNVYVVAPNGPTNTGTSTGVANSTNFTMIAWVYNNITSQPSQTGIVDWRSGQVLGTGMNGGYNVNNSLGFEWDANATYSYNSGPTYSSNTWMMVADVISPSNTVLYVGTTNRGLVGVVDIITNKWQNVGSLMSIGAELYAPSVWGGYISSVAIFTNSLSPGQIATLYAAGEGGPGMPVINVNPPPSFPVAMGAASPKLVASGYGGLGSTAWWQYSNSATLASSPSTGGWVKVGPGNSDFQGSALVFNGLSWTSVLQATNFQSSDIAAYEIVISNTVGYATSTVASLTPATGYMAYIETNGPSLMLSAFWPLNETNDPSGPGGTTPTVVAYDLYGGYNGLYGTNARDGGTNKGSGLAPVVGPGLMGFAGLPTNGALGVTNRAQLYNSFVDIATGPAYPNPLGQYLTLLGWIYPTVANEAAETGIFMERTGAANTAGLQYGNNTSDQIGSHWNGDTSYEWGAGWLSITSFQWNLVALSVNPTNLAFFVCNTNLGVTTYNQIDTNANIAFGSRLSIGLDNGSLYNNASRNFNGYMSSFAMFGTNLSTAQIASMFLEGWTGSQAPFIVSNIPVANLTNYLVAGAVSASISATALAGANGGGYWQVLQGGNWNPLSGGDFSASVQTTVSSGVYQVGTLNILNFQAGDAGSYRLLFTNAAGSATSSVVTLSLTSVAASSFAGQVINPANNLGVIEFWPLNETADPSVGTAGAAPQVTAYEIIQG